MGNRASKEDPRRLFAWQKLDTGKEETCRFDPRFEDIVLCDARSEVVVSDIANCVYRWKRDAQSEVFRLEDRSTFEYNRVTNVARHFDRFGTSLAWNENREELHYYDNVTGELFKLDCEEWIKGQYPGEEANIPQRQLINLGNGQVLFMIGHQGTEPDSPLRYDICQMDVKGGKAIQTVTMAYDKFEKESVHPVYWGFTHNERFNCVSVLVRYKKEKFRNEYMHVLLVSLEEGNVLWESTFNFVHDLSFNATGNYLAIFERPKTTAYGFVHVLNTSRREWVCQVKLTYGGLPLGWDGFTWCGDCLVFMAPYKLEVLSPEEFMHMHRRTPEEKEAAIDDGIKGLDEEETPSAPEAKADGEAQLADDDVTKQAEKLLIPNLTPETYKQLAESNKTKEICVLGVGTRWWDVEKGAMREMSERTKDENISKLIFEYAALSWAIVQFDYPKIASKDEEMRGSLSEVLEAGLLGGQNYLLLSKMGKDKRTGIFNHWVFYLTKIPNTFEQMWQVISQFTAKERRAHNVRIGLIGSQNKLQ